MGKFMDFDAAWAEEEKPELEFRACGKVWKIPGVIPASVVLRLAELREEKGSDAEIGEAEQLLILKDLFPEEVTAELLAAGISASQYGDLIRWFMAEARALVMDGAEGNVTAPKTGAV